MNCRFKPLLASTILLFGITGCGSSHPAAPSAGAAAPVPIIAARAAGLDQSIFRQTWMEVVPLDNGQRITRLFVDRDLVLACTPGNSVFGIAKSNGVLNFSHDVRGGGQEVGRPIVFPNRIIYTTQSSLEIYSRATGNFDKSVPLGFSISSDAVGSQDDIYLGINVMGGELADLNLAAAYVPIRWRMVAYGQVSGMPALYQNTLYIGNSVGSVYAVNTDRTPLWPLDYDRFDVGGSIVGDVVADDEGVYASSSTGRLVCLDRNSGRLRWQYLSPKQFDSGPIVTRTSVYQYVPEMGLAAIDKTHQIVIDPHNSHKVEDVNRSPRWICPEAVQFICEDRLFTYVRTNDNQIWILDRLTGAVRYRSGKTRFTSIGINTTDSTIYGATDDGAVYAITPVLRPGGPGFLE